MRFAAYKIRHTVSGSDKTIEKWPVSYVITDKSTICSVVSLQLRTGKALKKLKQSFTAGKGI